MKFLLIMRKDNSFGIVAGLFYDDFAVDDSTGDYTANFEPWNKEKSA